MALRPRSVFLVTGASSGFGREFVRQALAGGHRVVATARDAASLAPLVADAGERAIALSLDVTDPARCAAVVAEAEARFGSVDVLVNNAGYGYFGAQEEGEEDEIRRLFEVNVLAAARMVRLVLPGMRARGHGTVVAMSSIAGLVPNPGVGYYAASKFALEAMSEALAAEVASFGIGVLIVEPGPYATDFFRRSLAVAPALSVYEGTVSAENRDRLVNRPDADKGDPADAVAAVFRALGEDEPPLRLLIGPNVMDRATRRLAVLEAQVEACRLRPDPR
jgi:NAD(P)-dependent dehydrogenase (short-subunit alcohol dehydrogenase family)